ncbi:FtsX-like permease family protein [Clostridium sardiniense]|uniref:FtsX-like permease family protein n=1 Tax=Clostridium sardiniense TaxID=29369 RepID=UPI00195A13F2|nr:ABC transporter permease [Clostridium sardiniense]MBM7833367.1 putative ABC transport system permease protein [Clostridium sardiniense]
MYAKLAISNAKKSIKDYLIYFITITLCVSLFYAFTSLSSSSYEFITEESYKFDMLKDILKYSTYIITALLVVLIGYVNKYMIRRRQREFATYILLGAEQKNVALMFFIETLIVGILAIILGIFIGTLFSQVVTALVLITAKQEIVFTLKLYMDTVTLTFIFFVSMFCIIGLYNIKVLKKVKLINMLNAEKKTEFQLKRCGKVYGSISIISTILYVIAGYCTYKLIKAIDNPELIKGSEQAFIIVSLVTFILGTYALFYSLGYIIIFIKNRWIGFRYENTNLFLIGSIVSKIKTAPILMATISLTFLGAAISFSLTLLMSEWSLGYLDYRIPFDISISNEYSVPGRFSITDIDDIPNIDYGEIVEYLNEDNYNISEYCEVNKYFIEKEDFYKREKRDMPILAVKLSEFNKLRNMLGYEKVNLKNDEFTMQWAKRIPKEEVDKFINSNSNFKVSNKSLSISNTPYYTESLGEDIYNFYTNAIIILPDEICKDLIVASTDFYANTKKDMSYDNAISFENDYVQKWINNEYGELASKYDDDGYDDYSYFVYASTKVAEVSEILNATLAMRILGIYLGIVLLMISLTVLALQQLADSIEHKDRFNVLKKLGVEEKEISNIILKQISIYFIIPILVAIIGFIIFIYNYAVIFNSEISAYIGEKGFILNIRIALVLIVSIYVAYFIATYYTFKRNIKC